MNADALPTPTNRPRLRQRGLLRDVFEIVLLVLLTYTPINLATARAIVDGPSMQPTFYTGDLVLVNRAAYFFAVPQRGDIVVLHNPQKANGDDLLKRVVGLPGELVELRGGVLLINGERLEESYISATCGESCAGRWQLGPDDYFVLGDNRANSYDSHNYGPVARRLIVGQAWLRYWPLGKFAFIRHEDYQ
jgi:signal peptidase I